MPQVSFIIPAHNEELDLPATLDAINGVIRELVLDAEVIVANDASTDRTVEIGRSHGATVVSHEKRQIAATRNLGARAASGQFLFFVDADTQANADAVKQGIEALQAGAVAGGAMPTFDGTIPLSARLMIALFAGLLKLANLCGGAFFFCKRSAFDQAGGWNEEFFAGEEIELAKALKKHGRFRIVRARVVTSGRKLRTYSMRELIWMLIRLGVGGRKAVKDRSRLDLWYEPRRQDPFHAAGKAADAGSENAPTSPVTPPS